MLSVFSDEYYMRQALEEAKKADEIGEIPVGAVIVCDNRIVARSHNLTERLSDVTAHAEILAITAAETYLDNKYLSDCTLYVTLEPCVMCAGALAWSQIKKLVYAAPDDQRGFMRYGGKALLHPQTSVEWGILQEESVSLLRTFFRKLRKR